MIFGLEILFEVEWSRQLSPDRIDDALDASARLLERLGDSAQIVHELVGKRERFQRAYVEYLMGNVQLFLRKVCFPAALKLDESLLELIHVKIEHALVE